MPRRSPVTGQGSQVDGRMSGVAGHTAPKHCRSNVAVALRIRTVLRRTVRKLRRFYWLL